jgi:hypothetical protein
MSKTVRLLTALGLCLLLTAGVGCTRNRNRVRVSGEVTFAGQPVKVGRITFTPVGGGKGYSDTIHNGRYSVRSRTPMASGDYTVTIQCSSNGSSRGGFDVTRTERVTVAPLGRPAIDFDLK